MPAIALDPFAASTAQRVALALDCVEGRLQQVAGAFASEPASHERIARGPGRQPVLLVSGLSGAGKASILRVLEDLGFEAIDNPPLGMIEGLVACGPAGAERRIAVGVDARSRGFDAGAGARHAGPAAPAPGRCGRN